MLFRYRHLVFCLLVAIAMSPLSKAMAQDYPAKPIRWLIPFPAGGPTDILARTVGSKLSEELGVSVLIVNKPGAGGALGMAELASSANDGYTIGMGHTGTQAINPHLYASLKYDPLKDFEAVTPLVSYVNVLVVSPGLPVNSVKELVAYAKANPDKLTYASGGNGSTNHLSGELLKLVTGTKITHVPFQGNAPALVALMGNQISFMFDNLSTSLPQINAGKIRALAVTSTIRSEYAPNLPTMGEAGVPAYDQAGSGLWFGTFAPKGTPKPVIERLHRALVNAVQTPEVIEQNKKQAYTVFVQSPEEFTRSISEDYRKWGEIISKAGIKPQ